jgi:hypothetical protein
MRHIISRINKIYVNTVRFWEWDCLVKCSCKIKTAQGECHTALQPKRQRGGERV